MIQTPKEMIAGATITAQAVATVSLVAIMKPHNAAITK